MSNEQSQATRGHSKKNGWGLLKESTAKDPVSRFQVVLYHGLRLFLGVVFLYASYDKILNPQAFAQAVYNYQMLPDAAVNLVSLTLPWLELLLGLCLVAGLWLPGATALSTGLLAVFIGSLVFNQIRGLDVHCGCFSTGPGDGPAGLWTVARDVSFLVVSLVVTLRVFLVWPMAPHRYRHQKKERPRPANHQP